MTKLSKILCTNLYLDCTRMRCFVGRNFSAVSHPKVMITMQTVLVSSVDLVKSDIKR